MDSYYFILPDIIRDEIDVPLSYADYYYLEALARKRMLDTNHINSDTLPIVKE